MDAEAEFEGHKKEESVGFFGGLMSIVGSEEAKPEEEKKPGEPVFKQRVQMVPFDMDNIPYLDFINHFKQLEAWKPHITDDKSPFVRLFTTGDIFFKKRVIAEQKVVHNLNGP